MPEIQRPEIVREIEKRYGLKGYPGPGILSPEIVPVTLVDDLTQTESREKHPFVGQLYQAAGGAGTFATVQLYNGSESGVIVEPIAVFIRSATSSMCALRWNLTGTLTTAGTNDAKMDLRSGTDPAASLRSQALGAVITPHMHVYCNNAQINEIDLRGTVLVPDSSIYVNNNQANDGLYVSFTWTERPRTVEDGDIP